jgi:hypothetical protein
LSNRAEFDRLVFFSILFYFGVIGGIRLSSRRHVAQGAQTSIGANIAGTATAVL